MLGDVFNKLAEGVIAGDKVSFAVEFDEHAELAAVVNVAGDAAFVGGAFRFFTGDRDALFTKDDLGFSGVTVGFNKSLLAIHHSRAGFFAQGFNDLGIDFH